MMINLQLTFEDAGITAGEKCFNCKQIIEGTKFQMISQIGEVTGGNLKAYDNGFLCEPCRAYFIDAKKGAKV